MQQNHSLALPEFEDNLWQELEARHPKSATGSDARWSGGGWRRTSLRMLAAAATVAVLAGVGALAVSVTSTSDGPADADVRTTGDGANQAAEGEGADTSGQAQLPPDAVAHVQQVGVDGRVTHRWTDEANGRSKDVFLDASGNPTHEWGWSDLVENPDGSVTVSQWTVDHSTGTYSEDEWTTPADVNADWPRESWSEAAAARDAVEEGRALEDGLEVVDGRELLRLVDAEPGRACATSPSGTDVCLSAHAMDLEPDVEVCEGDAIASWSVAAQHDAMTTSVSEGSDPGTAPQGPEIVRPEGHEPDPADCVPAGELEIRAAQPATWQGVTWVDPETYRPVKRLGYPDSDAEYTMTFEYLERTPANLALVEQPDIPDSYTQE